MLSMHNLLSHGKAVAHWAQALTPQQMWHIHVSMAKLPQTHRCTRACPHAETKPTTCKLFANNTQQQHTSRQHAFSQQTGMCTICSCRFRQSCLKTTQVALHHEKEEEGYLHI